jgi:amidase
MRPTWGRLTLEGVMPMAPVMDTAGFFARDAALGRDFSKGWYGDLFDNYTSYPDVSSCIRSSADLLDSCLPRVGLDIPHWIRGRANLHCFPSSDHRLYQTFDHR